METGTDTGMDIKIGIGMDIGVGGRNGEWVGCRIALSRVFLCLLVSYCVSFCVFVSSHVFLCLLAPPCTVFLCLLVSSCVVVCLLVSSCVFLCCLVSSCVFMRRRSQCCVFLYLLVSYCVTQNPDFSVFQMISFWRKTKKRDFGFFRFPNGIILRKKQRCL